GSGQEARDGGRTHLVQGHVRTFRRDAPHLALLRVHRTPLAREGRPRPLLLPARDRTADPDAARPPLRLPPRGTPPVAPLLRPEGHPRAVPGLDRARQPAVGGTGTPALGA